MASSIRIVQKNPLALQQVLDRLASVTLTVGIHATERDEGGGPMAVIAGVHEFGSSRVPARPFFRPTIWKNRASYLLQLRGAVQKAIRGGKPLRVSLAVIGEGVQRDIQRTIRAQGEPAGSFAPLSPETVANRRQGRAPVRDHKGRFIRGHLALIDTGRMINSIRWVLSIDGQTTGAPAPGGSP